MNKTKMILAVILVFVLIGQASSMKIVVGNTPLMEHSGSIEDIDKYLADSAMEINRQYTPLHIPDNPDGIAAAIVLATLTSGILISAVSVMLYTKRISKKSRIPSTHREKTQSQDYEEKYKNTAFTEGNADDDFDYPYEDIGNVTRI